MRRNNVPLIIGTLILSITLFVALFPRKITKVNPYFMEATRTVNTVKGITLEGAPYPPSREHKLGTDEMGRDIFSFMVYGTRLTMSLALLIVLGRFLLAIPMGISAAFGSYISRTVIDQFNGILSAIPALIISVLILRMDFFTSLHKSQSIFAFVVVLTLVGWGRLAIIVRERVQDIMEKPFVSGEIAIGKSRLQIAIQNVIPHLAAELVVLFFMEAALALSMIMQLAVFAVFVGNLRIVASTDGGIMNYAYLSFEPEWASLMATGRAYLRTAPWVVLAPAAAFFLNIISLNFIGEGLRARLQDINSNFIVNLRRLLTFDKRFFVSRKFILTVSIVLAAAAIFGGININSRAQSGFILDKSSKIFKGEFKDQVVLGSREAEETAKSLGESLRGIGFEPLKGNEYITEYESEEIFAVTSSSLEIVRNGEVKSAAHGKDYSIGGFGNFRLRGALIDGTRLDLYSLKDYKRFEGNFILLSGSYYSRSAVSYFSEKLALESKALGLIWIMSEGKKPPESIGKQVLNIPIVYVTNQVSRELLKEGDEIRLNVESSKHGGRGRNVLGILKGLDNKLSSEAIIIGIGYNYMSYNSEVGKKRIILALELARKFSLQKENRGRSIILAFWDGNLDDSLHGAKYYADHTIFPMNKTVLNLDLDKLEVVQGNTVYYNSQQAPISRYFSWVTGYMLETNLKKSGAQFISYKNQRGLDEILSKDMSAEEALYYKATIPTLIVKLENEASAGEKYITLEELGTILFETIEKNTY